MAYYYAEKGKLNPSGGAVRGLVVQIVKGELRKIGDWEAFTHTPDDKLILGWTWFNTHKETRYRVEDSIKLALAGHKAELFEELRKIYERDNAFFHVIADKLNIHPWMFGEEMNRREDLANHTPRDVTYVIYNTDSNGYGWTVPVGEPEGSVKVRTTGDDRADQVTAIKRHLAAKTGKPEDEVMGVGFYQATIYADYAEIRDDHIQNLRDQLDAAIKHAIYED